MTLSNKNLKATSWFKPYENKNVCTLKKNGIGVYLIKKNGVIVYVGKSEVDAKKTLYRHFQVWTDKRHYLGKKNEIYERITYVNSRAEFKCKVIFCYTKKEVDLLEKVLILKIKPENNTQKIDFYSREDYLNMMQKFKNATPTNYNSDESPF